MDSVVHLAAIVGDPACARESDLARETNLVASLSLLEMSREAGIGRFVYASTCSNYGRMSDPSRYVDETSALVPLSLYAETKVAVEESILDSQRTGFSPTVLRFATVFGVSPRMRFDLTVNEFSLDMVAKGHLVVYGEQFWRPYAHVVDVARAISLVLSSPDEAVRDQVFNVGSTRQNYQKQQLVELIKPHAPDARVEYVRKEEDPRDYRVSFEKIQRELGFEITHTVEDGIREVVGLVRSGAIDNFNSSEFTN
jgi:nucleoside-diphosphate-sugar epimerase